MKSRKGNAVVETALMAPWIFFLFVGVLDMGFYCYSAMSTQYAARAAAMRAAIAGGGSNADACVAALGELSALPNMTGVSSCATYSNGITNSLPLSVCITKLTSGGSSDATCANTSACADCGATAISPSSIKAVVAYETLPMIPIPGLLMGRYRLTRVAEVRLIEP